MNRSAWWLVVVLLAACEVREEPVPKLVPSQGATPGGNGGAFGGDAATGTGATPSVGGTAGLAGAGGDGGVEGGLAGTGGVSGASGMDGSAGVGATAGAGGTAGTDAGTGGGTGGTVATFCDAGTPDAADAADAAGPDGDADATVASGCIVQIASGGDHTCARRKDGTLWCWGSNTDGQLGDGTSVDKSSPVQVSALCNAVAEVALGEHYTCARVNDGTVWCWGWNVAGQLGDGTTTDKIAPVQVLGLASTAAIEVGVHHSCAIKTDASLWCWGQNISGQVGDGTNISKSSPVQVVPLGNTTSEISLGSLHTCARKSNGTLWCWGGNSEGQLGIGTTVDTTTPEQVAAFANATAGVAVGGDHSCALRADGTVWCWGWNQRGQLGDGTTTSKAAPVKVVGLTGATRVAAGRYQNCAVKNDGTSWCWGWNLYGQLGDGTTVDKPAPVQVGSLGNAVADVSPGREHTCALETDGTVWCWGRNSDGQLGNGTNAGTVVPVQVQVPCP